MQFVEPEVYLVAMTMVKSQDLLAYAADIGAFSWINNNLQEPEITLSEDMDLLTEVAGKICYKSWEPGLNKNVRKIRTKQKDYLENLLKSGHGSTLEHCSVSFIFHNVSRIFTHELVRHRVGTAVSQESGRYVRADEIKFWLPPVFKSTLPDEFRQEIIGMTERHLEELEDWYARVSEACQLDNDQTKFEQKKLITSGLRRFLPDGMGTDILWTCNLRELRHVIEQRTSPGAEEEIQYIFRQVLDIMKALAPNLFDDYQIVEGQVQTPYPRV